MSIWDWLLVAMHATFEWTLWFFKYPLWENLYRQWEVQEDIYRKLGRPSEMTAKITRSDKINTLIYGGIIHIGTIAFAVQFFFTPKYALNTYAIVPADTIPLQIFFCFHEMCFMWHSYAYQASAMVLAESYATSYQHILEEMNKALDSIIGSAQVDLHTTKNSQDKVTHKKMKTATRNVNSNQQLRQALMTNAFRSTSKPIDLNITAPGTEYDIQTLLVDYKRVMISSMFHNQWIGLVMGPAEAFNYAQFVADVFMLIQLLKEPDTDFFGVFFYLLDATFGMIMLFRMLILLSRLYPQGKEFVQSLKTYATFNSSIRRMLVKTIPTLKVVSAKLTGAVVRPESVPVGINVLINWYICAAMWKRPDDPSRRT
ncbi:unnamed protein product [Orchesella dallaii]|uniref:Odorant receptor n=1 Tax=Orchesella dallaii TaxID=48710 RepID=A0ABP1RF42_9HEXA